MRGKAQATLALEKAIIDIVEERSPITVRGVCYALFVRQMISSMEVSNTARISRIMTDMRESEALDWELIVDGSRAVERVNMWRNSSALIKAAVDQYRRNNWQEQPTIVEVWSEKSTVQGVLAPVLDELGVTFRVMKGFGSCTALMQAATDSITNSVNCQSTVVLYIGDHDPSGLYMSEVDLPKRLKRYGGRQVIERIAILRADTVDLPHFEVATKRGDPRHDWFVEHHGRRCWELDAMDPNVLRDRVRNEIESFIDKRLWNRAIEIEDAEVESMNDFHAAWQSRLDGQP